MTTDLLRQIPALGSLLADPAVAAVVERHGQGLTTLLLREAIERLRADLRAGRATAVPAARCFAAAAEAEAARYGVEGRRAINATGILLHTGLGRAPLCAEAVAALSTAGGASLLQTDPDQGGRSLREERVERLLTHLSGAEAATVVNNNAAASLLALNTLCAGREAVLSRGQLVEIGGAYRIPDVMAASGAVLREIGTTNRTHLRDYRTAIGERSGALVHVHTSNYRVRGFAATPGIAEIAALAHEHRLPCYDDIGSGALVGLREFGVDDEPLVRDSIAAGADLVSFSGDKLIGGPQSGILLGTRDLITRIRANPFARMFRVCKLTLAALEATLVHFVNGTWRSALPFYRHLSRDAASVHAAATALAGQLAGLPGWRVDVIDDHAYVGSGSLPDQGIASAALRLAREDGGLDAVARRLRCGQPAVFGRVEQQALLLNLHAVADADLADLAAAVRAALAP